MGLAGWLLLFATALAIGAVVRRPPRHRVLLWPAGAIVLNIACVAGSRLLAFYPASSGGIVSPEECALALLTIAAALRLVYEPSLMLCCLLGGWLALTLVRYVFAFTTALQGQWTGTASALLRQPSWDLVLLGQLALAAGILSLAGIALMRADIFRPSDPDAAALF